MSSNILTEIIARKRVQNEQQEQHYPMSSDKHALSRSERSLYDALNQPQAGFILECKKASPSKGLIRPHFNPVELAKTYQPYAAAISVLTEPEYFQGSYEYLAAVSQQVNLPILCKDFFIDEQQVYRARYFGADAILLMLSVLDDVQYQHLHAIADNLGLDVLTEVANETEMRRAAQLGARIIGINHRDLTDLSINPNRSHELAPYAPEGALLVAESGFSQHKDIRRCSDVVNGFLVGSALSAENDVDLACRKLLYGENKVCGLTRAEDALNAHAAGAVFGGLIFAERSPRCIEPSQAEAIIRQVQGLQYVGVFADQPLSFVVDTAFELGLHAVQLHGHEDIDFTVELKNRFKQAGIAHVQIWKAVTVDAPFRLNEHPLRHSVDRFVLDHGQGGTGKTFDWQLLNELDTDERGRCLLAGGISPDNVCDAIEQGFSGVDASSKLEWQAGIKDARLISSLFKRIRHYGANANSNQSQEAAA